MRESSDLKVKKWEKGAVAGGIWGTAEMSLGSLLHNMNFPFTGDVLVSIAIVLLSGINIRWRVKGLFYRAGFTSALLKFFSPSPMIVPPAASIAIEGGLMEAGSRIGGTNPVGFALGGGLVSVWILGFKFIRLLMVYGANIYILYEQLFDKAVAFAGLKHLTPALGIGILVLIYFLLGIVLSLTGSYFGSRIKSDAPVLISVDRIPEPAKKYNQEASSKGIENASLWWLAGGVIITVLTMFFMTPYPELIPFLGIYCIFAMIRYKRSLRRLMQPKFILPILIISFASGVFVTGQGHGYLSPMAISGGLTLLFRAWLVTLSIGGIMYEMNHPLVAGFIKKRFGKGINGAMDVAWQTSSALAPSVRAKDALKNPLSVFRSAVMTAEDMLSGNKASVVVVTGEINSGKTTYIREAAARLKPSHKICGFYCAAENIKDVKDDYYLTDTMSGSSALFCKRGDGGGFIFYDDALKYGTDIVLNSLDTAEYVFIDESGWLELEGGGWHDIIMQALAKEVILVVSVRKHLLDGFMDHFGIRKAMVIDIDKMRGNA